MIKQEYLIVHLEDKEYHPDDIINRQFKGYSPDMTVQEVYDSARAFWSVDEDRFKNVISVLGVNNDGKVVIKIAPDDGSLETVSEADIERNKLNKGAKYFTGQFTTDSEDDSKVGQTLSIKWTRQSFIYKTESEIEELIV
ncbi:hypothetical protein ACFY6E_12390 [Staphylococcus cohnii]|uniref:hypothetical protein n=1 Tax=Staphylococcus cohnii TaxID=29382 RepID=UPI0036A99ECB